MSSDRVEKTSRILLIVDDHAIVRETMSELLCFCFDEVLVAANPYEAEPLLAERDVTHLLCDNEFGEGHPLGVAVIPRWRKRFPTIERAILFTGTAVGDVEQLPGVDRVVLKPAQCETLISTLAGTQGSG